MELRQQQTQAPSRVMSISFLVNNYPGDIDFSPAHADNYNNQFFHNDVDEDMEDVECDRSAIPEPTPKPIPDEHDNIESSKDSRPVVEIEFGTQWMVKKDAQWEIIKVKKSIQNPPGPDARGLPNIWSKNLHDAQDVLPYFSVGQTILTSKVPRVLARSALLTRNLENISVDWRSGNIRFSVHLKYKLELARPRKWVAPLLTHGFRLANANHKPPDPPQFRKLVACRDTGVPVRLFATGDFPTLPTVQREVLQPETGHKYTLGSNNWKGGLVALGFFWVKVAKEVHHEYKDLDFDLGKCTGQARWDFEFKFCETEGAGPPWWCPIPSDESETESDSELSVDSSRSCAPANARVIPLHEDMDLDEETFGGVSEPQWNQGTPQSNMASGRASQGFCGTMPSEEAVDDDRMELEHPVVNPPPRVQPSQLGLQMEPRTWSNTASLRPPQIRASLLLGWHCIQCGKLNPRVEWIATQTCPLCKTTINIDFPQWHRKAHTELSGPIGTLYRLDDGGHTPKVGLHQLAVRDPKNGRTCVEYWLADPPMPILAELNQTKPTRRVGAPRKASTKLPKAVPAPAPVVSIAPVVTQPPTDLVGGPKIAEPRKPRGAAGSRANLTKDTRMIFVHITCPQYGRILAVPDEVFSSFSAMVPMSRQENNSTYKTGPSPLSCHYTYLAGFGTNPLHSSSPAVPWEEVPKCVYAAHALLVDLQAYSVDEDDKEAREFNQSVFVVGNGAPGINSFKMVHNAAAGPVGYMVFGASCDVQVIVGDGESKRRTTKAGALRRAEVLMAHGDALFTSAPRAGDAPIEVRVKRTGLSIVVVASYVKPKADAEPEPVATTSAQSTKRTLARGAKSSLALNSSTNPGLSATRGVRKRKSDVL